MTSSISCPLWSSVYECQRVDVRSHDRGGLSVVCLWCAIYSVVCPCQNFWYVVLVCHQCVCKKNAVGSEYCGLSQKMLVSSMNCVRSAFV